MIGCTGYYTGDDYSTDTSIGYYEVGWTVDFYSENFVTEDCVFISPITEHEKQKLKPQNLKMHKKNKLAYKAVDILRKTIRCNRKGIGLRMGGI